MTTHGASGMFLNMFKNHKHSTGFITKLITALFLLVTTNTTIAQQTTVVGSTTGVMQATETANLSYSVPITVPPGVSGVQPQLSIEYSSSAGNGIAGLGGHFSVGASITRCEQSIFLDAQVNHNSDLSLGRARGVDLSNNDTFCLGGEALVLVDGTHAQNGAEYRTENESFQRISITSTANNSPQTFLVELPDGSKMTFGATADSRITHTDGRVLQWMASEYQDAYGNTINYYYQDVGQNGAQENLYSYITYGGTANIRIDFDYEQKPDTNHYFLYGIEFSSTQRLTNVRTSVDGATAKDYQISYTETPVSRLSRMTQIAECSGQGTCLPPVVFEWNEVDPEWTSSGGSTPDNLLDENGRTRGVIIDINGDGLEDWITAYIDTSDTLITETWLGDEQGGWQQSSDYALPSAMFKHSGTQSEVPLGQIVDIDGDGLLDWVQAYRVNAIQTLNAWRNTGSGWQTESTFVLPAALFENYKRSQSHVL